MKSKTTRGQHLKRLAKNHANALVDASLEEGTDDGKTEAFAVYLRARKALYDAIDEITSVNHAPRALQDLL